MEFKRTLIKIALVAGLSLLSSLPLYGQRTTKSHNPEPKQLVKKSLKKGPQEEHQPQKQVDLDKIISQYFSSDLVNSKADSLNYEIPHLKKEVKAGSTFKKNQVRLYAGYGNNHRAVVTRVYTKKNNPHAQLAVLLNEQGISGGIEGVINNHTRYAQAALGNSNFKFRALYRNGTTGYEVYAAPFATPGKEKNIKIKNATLDRVVKNPQDELFLKYSCRYNDNTAKGTLMVHLGILDEVIPGLTAQWRHSHRRQGNKKPRYQSQGKISYQSGPVGVTLNLGSYHGGRDDSFIANGALSYHQGPLKVVVNLHQNPKLNKITTTLTLPL